MSTFTKLNYHIVFSTKYRKRLIQNSFQNQLYDYIGGIIRAHEGHLIKIGGVEDHIHMLVGFPPTNSFSDIVRSIKANSSKWMNETLELGYRFEWQKGYGAFTVSYSHLESVSQYIQNQRAHHHKKTFEEEFLSLLNAHNINYEPKYLFENEYCG